MRNKKNLAAPTPELSGTLDLKIWRGWDVEEKFDKRLINSVNSRPKQSDW